MKEFCLNQVIIHVLPEQPRAHRSCSFASCDPRQSHHCLNCFYHNVPLFLPAAELLGGITSLPERSVLAEADAEQNKNHRFSLWNISGKHFFPGVGNPALHKMSFPEGKVVCFSFFLRENVQSV